MQGYRRVSESGMAPFHGCDKSNRSLQLPAKAFEEPLGQNGCISLVYRLPEGAAPIDFPLVA